MDPSPTFDDTAADDSALSAAGAQPQPARGGLRVGGLSWRRRAFWVVAIALFVQLVGMYGPGSGGY